MLISTISIVEQKIVYLQYSLCLMYLPQSTYLNTQQQTDEHQY